MWKVWEDGAAAYGGELWESEPMEKDEAAGLLEKMGGELDEPDHGRGMYEV